jgi:hypothetical protein
MPFNGRDIRVETPAEILCKKLQYRGSRLTVRDIFDLACTAKLAPTEFAQIKQLDPSVLRRVLDRAEKMAPIYRAEVASDILVTDVGRTFLNTGVDIAVAELRKVSRAQKRDDPVL